LEKPFAVLKGEIEEKERRAKDVVLEILLDVVMEKNSLEEKTSLSTQVGAPPAVAQLLAWTARSPRRPTR
jgi:hypothetical protein